MPVIGGVVFAYSVRHIFKWQFKTSKASAVYYSRVINKVTGDPVDINLCHVKVRGTWMSPFMEEVRDQRGCGFSSTQSQKQ